jgi:CubicO group peptidase (beta-lactamase class C family)
MSRLDHGRIARLPDVMASHVESDAVGGVAWLAACGREIEAGVAGALTRGKPAPVRRDSIFRIASMTKPVVAVAALLLVEECRLRLDDPVDALLPELAGRRVLVDGRGPIDGDAVPARRPITVHDVLTFRLGLGMDFEAPWPQPLIMAMAELGLGSGPPEPQVPPAPDEWLRRLSTLPLLYQPGERWLYNTGADVLGVLVARAAGQPLEEFLRERVFEPLGMLDTGFSTDDVDRLGSCYATDPATGERRVYDAPSGQWAKPPAFPSGGGGLVSTVDDLLAFGQMMLDRGVYRNHRILSRPTVETMTTDQITPAQKAASTFFPEFWETRGWGFGVSVVTKRDDLFATPGRFGWDGGYGTSWYVDPAEDMIGVLMTQRLMDSPIAPAVFRDFWTSAYQAIDD